MRIAQAREFKRALVELVKKNVELEEVKEWLWEDFGARVRSWAEAERFMMREEVTIADLYIFLRENDVEVGEVEGL
ncbi:MAG: hypothetical protein ABDH61_05375 [Acidilobaceae archaeon]